MCIEIASEGKLKKSIKAYKVVRKTPKPGVFKSIVNPSTRSLQPGYYNVGKCLQYEIGKTYRSPIPVTPGFYCYASRAYARYIRSGGFNTFSYIIQVVVPKGATIRNKGLGEICVSRLEVVKVVR